MDPPFSWTNNSSCYFLLFPLLNLFHQKSVYHCVVSAILKIYIINYGFFKNKNVNITNLLSLYKLSKKNRNQFTWKPNSSTCKMINLWPYTYNACTPKQTYYKDIIKNYLYLESLSFISDIWQTLVCSKDIKMVVYLYHMPLKTLTLAGDFHMIRKNSSSLQWIEEYNSVLSKY